MNAKNFEYSLKNIPSPSKAAYLKSLIDKVEHFLKRMRWKAFFFDKEPDLSSSSDSESNEEPVYNYGFKTPRTPTKSIHLMAFEEDIYKLVQNIKFARGLNDFQQKLKRDVREIQSSNKLLVPADKSTNLYELDTLQYNKLLNENITKVYKKTQCRFEDRHGKQRELQPA